MSTRAAVRGGLGLGLGGLLLCVLVLANYISAKQVFHRFDLMDAQAFYTGVVIGVATIPGSAIAAWLVTRLGARLHVLFMEILILTGGAFMLWYAWR